MVDHAIYNLSDGTYHYIGITKRNPEERLREHRRRAQRILEGRERTRSKRLYHKMIERGLECFQMEILYQCNEDEAEQLELWIIEEYISLYGRDSILNTTLDGSIPRAEGEDHWNASFSLEEIQEMRYLYTSGKTITGIAHQFHARVKTVSGIIHNRSWYDPSWDWKPHSKYQGRGSIKSLIEENLEEIKDQMLLTENLTQIMRNLFGEGFSSQKKVRASFRYYLRKQLEEEEFWNG